MWGGRSLRGQVSTESGVDKTKAGDSKARLHRLFPPGKWFLDVHYQLLQVITTPRLGLSSEFGNPSQLHESFSLKILSLGCNELKPSGFMIS